MENKFKVVLLTEVETFIAELSVEEQDKISASVEALRNKKFDSVYLKQIKGDLKELKVRKYRLLFIIHQEVIYFLRIFVKKTRKTPKNEIDMAEKYYKLITN